MRSALVGVSWGRPTGLRVPQRIALETEQNLRSLLARPEMRGVDISEFLNRAIEQAINELVEAYEEAQ